MTIDERIEALVKASEQQRFSIEKQHEEFKAVLESFREFREDRLQINQTLRTLIEKVDTLTGNVDRLERFFERSLVKPPNGKTKGGEKK